MKKAFTLITKKIKKISIFQTFVEITAFTAGFIEILSCFKTAINPVTPKKLRATSVTCGSFLH